MWPWSPSATPRCGSASSRVCSSWRPAPATTHRLWKGSTRSWRATTSSIAFNPTFLLDGLSAIDSPVAQLSFTTSTKPALLSGKPAVDAEADEAYKYLIMPVRLSG